MIIRIENFYLIKIERFMIIFNFEVMYYEILNITHLLLILFIYLILGIEKKIYI
jgi:hypothetical protein